MLIGWRELADLCLAISDDTEWDELPSEGVIASCWMAARDVAGSNPSLEDEVAALFFALSRATVRLRDAAILLPITAAIHQLEANDLEFVGLELEAEALNRLHDEIDDGASWETVQEWFHKHTRRIA